MGDTQESTTLFMLGELHLGNYNLASGLGEASW